MSRDVSRSPTGYADEELTFPQFPRSTVAGPPSIISSRMTDIASDDGEDHDAGVRAASPNKRSVLASDTMSRPGTARTGMSSMRGPPSHHLRSGLAKRRQSGGATSVAGSTRSGRSPSSAGRSHVPSLTSHAFFHPMSSQKLQAQRGVTTRPMATQRQYRPSSDHATNAEFPGHSVASGSQTTSPIARITRQEGEEAGARRPQSRGSEFTEQETLDRITANTSPTHGHYPTGSLSESVRPLQKKIASGKGLSLRVDKDYKNSANIPTPIKSPRSFRSSFLLPSRGDSSRAPSNRDMQGGEKLESVASTPQPQSPAMQHSQPARSKEPQESLALKVGRNFEYFEGNTVFWMGGRLQNTRSRPVNIATGTVVLIPGILFFASPAAWLWHNISLAIPIGFAYIFLISLSSFFHASVSDPGIIPRNLHKFPPVDENEDPLRLGPPTNDWTLIKSSESSTAAMEVPTKYCKTCNIWRPPRTHHCRMCDNCIETADHHCVWLNNCVGRRNYRYFFAFVTSTSLAALYLLGACLAQILVFSSRQGVSFGVAIDTFRISFAIIIYCFLGALYPLALMGYHLFLMARGETTREFLASHKFSKKDRYRAFTQGNWVLNWVSVLCRPRPPTYYRFKNAYVAGDQRLAATAGRRKETKEGLEMQDVGSGERGFQGPVAVRGEGTGTAQ